MGKIPYLDTNFLLEITLINSSTIGLEVTIENFFFSQSLIIIPGILWGNSRALIRTLLSRTAVIFVIDFLSGVFNCFIYILLSSDRVIILIFCLNGGDNFPEILLRFSLNILIKPIDAHNNNLRLITTDNHNWLISLFNLRENRFVVTLDLASRNCGREGICLHEVMLTEKLYMSST